MELIKDFWNLLVQKNNDLAIVINQTIGIRVNQPADPTKSTQITKSSTYKKAKIVCLLCQ